MIINFFPLGNPFVINSSLNVYSCNRELLGCRNSLIRVQVTVWILPPMCIKLKLVMVKGRTISPTVKSVVAQQASELLDFVQRRRFFFHGKYYQNNEENAKRTSWDVQSSAHCQRKIKFRRFICEKGDIVSTMSVLFGVCLNVCAENWKRNNPKRSELMGGKVFRMLACILHNTKKVICAFCKRFGRECRTKSLPIKLCIQRKWLLRAENWQLSGNFILISSRKAFIINLFSMCIVVNRTKQRM